MKWCKVMVLFLVIFPPVGESFEDDFTRIGISVGGTHIVGVFVERNFGNTSVRVESGYLLNAISFDIVAIRYFGKSKQCPYIGFGLLKFFEYGGLQSSNLLCFPYGVDFDMENDQYMGAELTSCFPLYRLEPESRRKKDIKDCLLPIASVSYKYRF